MTEAKSVQLDGLQRQDEWVLRIPTAENRCLNLPFITPHAPSCSSQQSVTADPFASQPITLFTHPVHTAKSRRTVQPLLRGPRRSDGGQSRPFGGEALQGPGSGCITGSHLLLGGRFRAELLESWRPSAKFSSGSRIRSRSCRSAAAWISGLVRWRVVFQVARWAARASW
ncbi:hypothetical protein ACFV2I_33300 [Streptomyces microflavus]|uniref:hypothetical protein n=1 Tax=Streptomyces microflavus TaxID=1919 RepID=UPI0036A53857